MIYLTSIFIIYRHNVAEVDMKKGKVRLVRRMAKAPYYVASDKIKSDGPGRSYSISISREKIFQMFSGNKAARALV